MTNAEARFNKSHIRKVYACLAVTCHLHFWQNDRDFLRATVVTGGGTDTEIRVSTHFIHPFIVQELCESRGGRPELSVITSLLVSVDVKDF